MKKALKKEIKNIHVRNANIGNIKLKDRLDCLNKELFMLKTWNPTENLKLMLDEKQKQKFIISNKRNLILFAFVGILFFASASLNSHFSGKYDAAFIRAISLPFVNTAQFLVAGKSFIFDNLTSPYVVTVGEYGNIGVAKDEAKKLLSQFRQIDIREISKGVYTFEITRFSSKEKAYELADKLTLDDLSAVHVRYLPGQ